MFTSLSRTCARIYNDSEKLTKIPSFERSSRETCARTTVIARWIARTNKMLPFEFIIEGLPVSQQTRRRTRFHEWKKKVREEAEKYWPKGELPHAEPVMMKVTYFYDTVAMDVDNIPKPISDALNGLVYFDDDQLTDSLARKRNLNSDLTIENPSTILADGVSRGTEFLYVVVEEAPNQHIID